MQVAHKNYCHKWTIHIYPCVSEFEESDIYSSSYEKFEKFKKLRHQHIEKLLLGISIFLEKSFSVLSMYEMSAEI